MPLFIFFMFFFFFFSVRDNAKLGVHIFLIMAITYHLTFYFHDFQLKFFSISHNPFSFQKAEGFSDT